MGPASDGEGERLRRYVEELGLGQHVLVLGPVPRSEVPRYLGLASVTVSPIPTTALYVASSPTKAVESLALGVPVVGTPIPDQAELIAASGGGSVAPFEEEPFAAAVAELLADPPAARRMGAKGRRHVRSHRSYERLADGVEARYLALVPKGGPGVPSARG
jgi:glycosyltransferase involved in cell wall biosynthesis